MAILFFELIAFIGFFIFGFLLVSKFVHYSIMEKHNEVAGFVYAVVGVIYAVLLAFVVVSVWEQSRDAENILNSEVSHAETLYKISDSFPAGIKSEFKSDIVNYMNTMIEYEFKAMEKSTTSEEAKTAYINIWKSLQKYKPATDFETLWYQKYMDELVLLSDARGKRIISINLDLHPFMWIILFFGAFITIGFSYLFGTKNKFAHIIMIFCLASVIGLVLILIDAFLHPFSGIIYITPEVFINALKQMK